MLTGGSLQAGTAVSPPSAPAAGLWGLQIPQSLRGQPANGAGLAWPRTQLLRAQDAAPGPGRARREYLRL